MCFSDRNLLLILYMFSTNVKIKRAFRFHRAHGDSLEKELLTPPNVFGMSSPLQEKHVVACKIEL